MMISPIHNTDDAPNTIKVPNDGNMWSIELKIDIFHAQVDGWYLEIADRIINGWKSPSGEDYIKGVCSPNTQHAGKPTNIIADSAFAALQIMMNYFETIRFYKSPTTEEKSTKARFIAGVEDVFPREKTSPANVLYRDMRSGLYHAIPTNRTGARITLSHKDGDNITVFTYDETTNSWEIDPHNFVRALRQHLNQFVVQLKDPNQVDLRINFEKAFNMRTFGEE
jgi:hypothetical protein